MFARVGSPLPDPMPVLNYIDDAPAFADIPGIRVTKPQNTVCVNPAPPEPPSAPPPEPPSDPPAAEVTLCADGPQDACAWQYAKNGRCEDGGPDADFAFCARRESHTPRRAHPADARPQILAHRGGSRLHPVHAAAPRAPRACAFRARRAADDLAAHAVLCGRCVRLRLL